MSKSETIMSYCPHCGNRIRIYRVWAPGGANDRGGWVLECVGCRKPFHQHLGKDIEMSSITSGALVLATYDDEVAGSKDDVLQRYGLSEKRKKISSKTTSRLARF